MTVCVDNRCYNAIYTGLHDVIHMSPVSGVVPSHMNINRPSSQNIHLTFTPKYVCTTTTSMHHNRTAIYMHRTELQRLNLCSHSSHSVEGDYSGCIMAREVMTGCEVQVTIRASATTDEVYQTNN